MTSNHRSQRLTGETALLIATRRANPVTVRAFVDAEAKVEHFFSFGRCADELSELQTCLVDGGRLGSRVARGSTVVKSPGQQLRTQSQER